MVGRERRAQIRAESHVPELLSNFLVDLEETEHSSDVWRLLVALGRTLNLPYIDFVTSSNYADWKKALFLRTSYDSSWMDQFADDPDIQRWSYFQSHAMGNLTPIAVGLEFADEYHNFPRARLRVLEEAARNGLRSGFSIPLRVHAPPQAAMITFSGDHAKRDMERIIRTHGWVLNVAAIMGHQRYMTHFSAEFSERNRISNKQRELLALIGRGLQDKQIAETLGITVSAVRQRMNLVLAKTGLGNRTELAVLAMSMGLLPDPLERGGDRPETIVVRMGSGGQSDRVRARGT